MLIAFLILGSLIGAIVGSYVFLILFRSLTGYYGAGLGEAFILLLSVIVLLPLIFTGSLFFMRQKHKERKDLRFTLNFIIYIPVIIALLVIVYLII